MDASELSFVGAGGEDETGEPVHPALPRVVVSLQNLGAKFVLCLRELLGAEGGSNEIIGKGL